KLTLNFGKNRHLKGDWEHSSKSDLNFTHGNMILNPDFKEFFRLLNANGVHYMIVGGYAVAYHGYPRYTKDIDVWIWVHPENAAKIEKTLRDFGFESLGLQASDFLEEGTIVQLGYAPNRIDLIMGIPGVDFEECYAKRVEEEIDGVSLSFIDLENLKKAKKASGRLQDLADVENLE
ncbi:MAG: hypothetical protein AB1649_26300, partial [Chloroflexota bacterium]